ncbi:MAG: DUF1592 domain-containing protein [Deltaproteobacteria bacterium]|nr:DUF1592 domain-containing protein [Deltaproteobacteria bacterium]
MHCTGANFGRYASATSLNPCKDAVRRAEWHLQPAIDVLTKSVVQKGLFGGLLLFSACTGAVVPSGNKPPDETGGAGGTVGLGSAGKGGNAPEQGHVESQLSAAVIRRLNKFEYNNVVRDLLGDTSNPALRFTAEESALGFSNNAAALTVPPLLAEQYLYAAETLAKAALPKLAAQVSCLAAQKDEACVRTFVQSFGAKLWRSPVTTADETRLVTIYKDERARDGAAFDSGMEAVLTTMLISAPFLYRIEVGEATSDGKRRPTSYEMASRLSFFLWGTTPDDELLKAAAQDQLKTAAQVQAQANRMVKDKRTMDMVRNFHGQWLRYGSLSPQVTKDTKTFSTFSPNIAERMKRESDLFVQSLFSNGDSTFQDLFLSSTSFADATLATFYDLKQAVTTDEFAAVDLTMSRPGILTRGAWLTFAAHNNQTSPTLRGKFVLERILCGTVPPPPPAVNNTPVPVSTTRSTRERMAAHTNDPSCSGCHKLMDPLGFAFEGFDAVGRIRTQDAGKPVDATTKIEEGPVTGEFDGVRPFMQSLAQSADVRACVAKHWLRYALGRGETEADAKTIANLAGTLNGGAGVWPQLLVALTQTDAFMTLAPQQDL